MQLGPGRSPCRREATVTTLPKTVCLTWSHREQQAKNFSTMMPSVRRNLHSRQHISLSQMRRADLGKDQK